MDGWMDGWMDGRIFALYDERETERKRSDLKCLYKQQRRGVGKFGLNDRLVSLFVFLLSVLSSLVIERTNSDHKIHEPNNVVDIVSKERDDKEQKECSDDVGTKLCANRWIAHYDSCSLDDLFPFLLSPRDTLRHRQLSSKEASPNNNPPPSLSLSPP